MFIPSTASAHFSCWNLETGLLHWWQSGSTTAVPTFERSGSRRNRMRGMSTPVTPVMDQILCLDSQAVSGAGADAVSAAD